MVREFPGSTAHEATVARFGRPVRLVEKRVTVATTVTQLLENNPRRIFWQAVNRTVYNGALGFAYDLTFDNGILIGGNGGSASMAVDEDGEAVGYAVYAINQTAGGTWYVMEILGV